MASVIWLAAAIRPASIDLFADSPGLRVAPREQLLAPMEAGGVDVSVTGRPPKEIATRAEPFAAHPLSAHDEVLLAPRHAGPHDADAADLPAG